MPAYKVVYFNGRGRAEVIRLALVQAGIEFEDVRYEREEWAANKAKAPMGTLPYIEVDGKQLSQSMACTRYVAKEHGLMGKDSWEEAQINCVADTANDIFDQMIKIYFAKSDEDKVAPKEKIPVIMKNLENILKKNNDGSGFFFGDSVTLADLIVFATSEALFKMAPESKDAAPLITAHSERVAAQPNIAAWLKKRPDTQM